MPIFLDRHDMVESSAKEVAKLHVKDLEVQDKYGVKFLTYWYDAERRTTFCLLDAPDKETADKVHAEAHGHVANDMIALATEVGFRLGRWVKAKVPESAKSHIGTLEAAVLALLALMLGFSFAMSLSRYDTRRNLVLAEAAAIDTTVFARTTIASASKVPGKARSASRLPHSSVASPPVPRPTCAMQAAASEALRHCGIGVSRTKDIICVESVSSHAFVFHRDNTR